MKIWILYGCIAILLLSTALLSIYIIALHRQVRQEEQSQLPAHIVPFIETIDVIPDEETALKVAEILLNTHLPDAMVAPNTRPNLEFDVIIDFDEERNEWQIFYVSINPTTGGAWLGTSPSIRIRKDTGEITDLGFRG